jgi:geranylgeranyl diphosphate synthase type I
VHVVSGAVEQLGAYTARIDRQIAEVVEQEIDDPWLRNAIGYHLGWLDERFEPPERAARRPGGKKLRATLAVVAFRAAEAGAIPPADRDSDPDADAEESVVVVDIGRVLPFAAAIELLHNWSIVHDDIEDGDRLRRGRPALWTICGEAKAINVGDCLHALAFSCLGRLRAHGVTESEVSGLLSEMARTAVELTVGQMRDLIYETAPDVDSLRYLQMVEGKTAALMRCSTYGGALLGAGDRTEARTYGEFGQRLGLSFQMRDDILGIWAADTDTGKSAGGDICRRKKTLPVVLGFERASEPDSLRLQQIYEQDDPVTPSEEQYVREVLDRCGARDLTQEWAERLVTEAVGALDRTQAHSRAQAVEGHDSSAERQLTALHDLADFVTQRSY